jgi:hypothetical protein
VANWTGYGFKFTTGNKQWRGPFGLQIVPAAILACGIFLFPEVSPTSNLRAMLPSTPRLS